jgi:hypothetical protein
LILSDPNLRQTHDLNDIHHNHECEKYQMVSFGNVSHAQIPSLLIPRAENNTEIDKKTCQQDHYGSLKEKR